MRATLLHDSVWLWAMVGLLVLYGFPGILTADGIDQLTEARQGVYSDAHPPLFSWLWRQLDAIVAGPILMLVLQCALVVWGAFWVVTPWLGRRGARWVTLAVMLFPPVFAPLAAVWKDNLMAGLLLVGAAGLQRNTRWSLGGGSVALTFACGLRYNAFAATVPLVVLGLRWGGPPVRFRQQMGRYATAFGAAVVMMLAALWINARLTTTQTHYWHMTLAPMDIAGIVVHRSGERELSDQQVRDLVAGTPFLPVAAPLAALQRAYRPDNYNGLIVGPTRVFDIVLANDMGPAARQSIAATWWRLVRSYPGAYLRHRWAGFRGVIGFASHRPSWKVVMHQQQTPAWLATLQLPAGSTLLQDRVQRAVLWLSRHTPLFAPWLYLMGCALLGAWCAAARLRKRTCALVHAGGAGALVWSGLGLLSSLFFLAPTPDYRYSHWLVLVTSLIVATLVAGRRSTANVGALPDQDVRA